MARSVAERYLVAAFAFMAAATWFGVGLTNGFACLFVFVLAFQGVRLYQRRSGSRSRSSSRRDRPSRDTSVPAEELDIAPRLASGRSRSRPSGGVYDADREQLDWSVASEAVW